jgi:hypothetical protein
MHLVLKISFVVACLNVMWLANAIPKSYADGYLDFPIRLVHSPTICALEPQHDPQYPKVGKQMLDETNYAVLDWKDKLNQGMQKRPLWNLTLIEVPLGEQPIFDYSRCDITINFFRAPADSSLQYAVAGLTIPNFDDGKTRIEIYYLGIQVVSKMVEWQQGDTTYYKYVDAPQYTGFIANQPQLAGTIRHELGHSFGLGHYIVQPSELQSIVVGTVDMPSIMIDTATVIGVTHYDITPLDIGEVKSIYGPNGFNDNSAHNPYSRINVISIDKPNYAPGNKIQIGINTSGFNAVETGSLFVLDPYNSLMGIATVTKTNSTFLVQNENKTGKYYLEYLDNQKDLYDFSSFTVSSGGFTIPSWIKNNAKWWSEGSLGDQDFIKGIQYLIQNDILKIPQTSQSRSSEQIPPWVKNTAGWWANEQTSDDEFVRAIQYLVANGIIKI